MGLLFVVVVICCDRLDWLLLLGKSFEGEEICLNFGERYWIVDWFVD